MKNKAIIILLSLITLFSALNLIKGTAFGDNIFNSDFYKSNSQICKDNQKDVYDVVTIVATNFVGEYGIYPKKLFGDMFKTGKIPMCYSKEMEYSSSTGLGFCPNNIESHTIKVHLFK